MASKAKPRKAAAAKAEKAPTEKTIEWKGLTLTLPAELPDDIFLDLALVRSGSDATSTFDLLLTAIGRRQFVEVRAVVKAGEAKTEDVAELANEVFAVYGTSEGESEASQDS
jgi:hypothetical protein